MNVKSIILNRQRPTRVDSAREDPSSGGDRRFYQAFTKHLLEFRLQVEVLETSVDRDEQGGQLQLPVLHHQMQQVVGFGVIGDANILGEKCLMLHPHHFSHAGATCKNYVSEPHHGLVDEPSTLELN